VKETHTEELVAGCRNPSVPEACRKRLSVDQEPTPWCAVTLYQFNAHYTYSIKKVKYVQF